MPILKLTIYRLILLLCLAILVGCISMPKSMRVDSGATPKYQDDNVRFRTTYYFRVVSLCGNELDTSTGNSIETDSLYRFRMTGKAGALANKIHFESGILHKNIIDPFGTVIRHDAESGRAYVSSHDDIQRESKRKMYLSEIKEYSRYLEDGKFKDQGEAKQLIQELIKNNFNNIKKLDPVQLDSGESEENLTESDSTTTPGDTKKPPESNKTAPQGNKANSETKNLANTSSSTTECKPGKRRQGFQILGPQGITTFDQDQRLILSMSTSAKPLVSTLKELATRMMPRPTNTTETLLLITQERLKLSHTERELINLENELEKPDNGKMTPQGLVTEVLNIFEAGKK